MQVRAAGITAPPHNYVPDCPTRWGGMGHLSRNVTFIQVAGYILAIVKWDQRHPLQWATAVEFNVKSALPFRLCGRFRKMLTGRGSRIMARRQVKFGWITYSNSARTVCSCSVSNGICMGLNIGVAATYQEKSSFYQYSQIDVKVSVVNFSRCRPPLTVVAARCLCRFERRF
jgi:hypothetical protein